MVCSTITQLCNTLIVAAAVTLAASAAHAQPKRLSKEKAQEHFKRGRAYHDLKQYDKAAAEYLKAYKYSEAPKLLFNVAQVYRLSGERDKAIEYYDRYLKLEPNSDISAVAREERDGLKQEIAAEQAKREAEAARKAEADAKQAEEARRAEKAREAEQAKRAEEERLRVEREAPIRQWRDGVRRARIVQISGAVVGAAGLVAIGLGARSGSEASSISDELSNVTWSPELDDRIKDGEAAERNMKIFYGVGAGAVVVGAGLFVLGMRAMPGERPDALTVVPTVSPTSTGVSVLGRF